MKRTILLVIIIIVSIFIGFVFGTAVENKFDFWSTNKAEKEVVQKYNDVEKQYFDMIKDKHDRELVMKAYDFLRSSEKNYIDYKIKPDIGKVDYDKRNDGYYVISFRTKLDGIYYNDTIHNMIGIGIDIKNEHRIRLLPID